MCGSTEPMTKFVFRAIVLQYHGVGNCHLWFHFSSFPRIHHLLNLASVLFMLPFTSFPTVYIPLPHPESQVQYPSLGCPDYWPLTPASTFPRRWNLMRFSERRVIIMSFTVIDISGHPTTTTLGAVSSSRHFTLPPVTYLFNYLLIWSAYVQYHSHAALWPDISI